MTQPTVSLWPDIPAPTSIRTPMTILREQAAALSQKTETLVEGRVTTTHEGDTIVVDFDFVVPSLQYYSYRLLRVVYGAEPYPVRVAAHSIPPTVAMSTGGRATGTLEALNEDTFVALLRDIFRSEQTQRILAALTDQARSCALDQAGS